MNSMKTGGEQAHGVASAFRPSLGALLWVLASCLLASPGCKPPSSSGTGGSTGPTTSTGAGGGTAAICALDCAATCNDKNTDLACGDGLCGFWDCVTACAKAPSPWCCVTSNGAKTADSELACEQMAGYVSGQACPQSVGPGGNCGTASPGGCGVSEGSAGCPFCCTGICGLNQPACFSRADCCSDGCGASGMSGAGIECGNRCVDGQNDTNNCGACGNSCPSAGPGEFGPNPGSCQGGACQCGMGVANQPLVLCSNHCVDTVLDSNNCGGCGTKCVGGQICNTQCMCVPQTDLNACGGCKTACAIPGGLCKGSTCVCPGKTPLTCSGGCVDAAIDPANCGACGATCVTGQSCESGMCHCPGVSGVVCAGVCVDSASDDQNCGACGKTCANGTGCIGAVCVTGATCPPVLA